MVLGGSLEEGHFRDHRPPYRYRPHEKILETICDSEGPFRSWTEEGVLFVSVLDDHFMTLAHTDPASVGKKEEDPFLRNSLRTSRISTRLYQPDEGEEVLEIGKSFPFNPGSNGLVLIGYSPKRFIPCSLRSKKTWPSLSFSFSSLGACDYVDLGQSEPASQECETDGGPDPIGREALLAGPSCCRSAHEIRNPLNAIGMGLQRLKREFTPQEESKKRSISHSPSSS